MKDPRWKQANPVDQLRVIRMSLEGHADNLESGRKITPKAPWINQGPGGFFRSVMVEWTTFALWWDYLAHHPEVGEPVFLRVTWD